MDNRNNYLTDEFLKYLQRLGISKESHKNYKSDLSNFTIWSILKIRSDGTYVESLKDVLPFLSNNFVRNYKQYLIDKKTPVKTINRRLSTLRHLCRFLVLGKFINYDFMCDVENIGIFVEKKKVVSPILTNFKFFLEQDKTTRNTVKNYINDIKQFLLWHGAKNISPDSLNTVSTDVIKNYQNYIIGNYSKSTLKRKTASLNKFFGWAKGRGYINSNPVFSTIYSIPTLKRGVDIKDVAAKILILSLAGVILIVVWKIITGSLGRSLLDEINIIFQNQKSLISPLS